VNFLAGISNFVSDSSLVPIQKSHFSITMRDLETIEIPIRKIKNSYHAFRLPVVYYIWDRFCNISGKIFKLSCQK